MTRIKTFYKKNPRKTFGCSQLLRDEYISKADPACDVHSCTEYLRIQSTKVLRLLDLREDKENWTRTLSNSYKFLHWVEQNMSSLSAFCFNKGGTDHNYHFKKNVLDYLVKAREDFIEFIVTNGNEGQTSSVDFFITDYRYVEFDEWRVRARDLERAYIRWLNDPRVVLDAYTQARQGLQESDLERGLMSDLLSGFNLRIEYKIVNAEILNHFSNFMYWFIRYLWVLDNGTQGIKEWQMTCTELEVD